MRDEETACSFISEYRILFCFVGRILWPYFADKFMVSSEERNFQRQSSTKHYGE